MAVGIVRAVRFVGQSGKDTFYGTFQDDWITGGSGDDILAGGDGSDLIDGGSDSDQLFGDVGDDLLFGGSGNDIQYGGSGNDQLDGGSGNDTAEGGIGNDTLFGRADADVLDGGAGDDLIYGGTGNDTFIWTGSQNIGARDTIFGGDGNDLLKLDVTAAQWASPAFQIEYAAFLNWIAGPAGSAGENGPRFTFNSLGGLTVAGTNRVEVTIDGAPSTPVDDPVDAVDDLVSVSEDGPTFNGNVLTNDSVADGVGSVALLSTTTHGTLVFNPDGTFAYTPGGTLQTLAAGQTAIDTFTYSVVDTDGDSDTATVTITITGANDQPVAVSISGAVGEDGSTVLAPSFTDIDVGDTHTTSVNTTGTIGQVSVNGDGTIRYDAAGRFDNLAAGHTATDTFSYTITDNNGGTSTATALVTVTGANDAPTVNGISGGASEDGPAINLTPAFSDPDSIDSHTTSLNLAGTVGAVSVNGDGSIRYDASGHFDSLAAGETATDTFAYTMTDALGATGTATAVITVTGQNDGPTVGAANLAGLVTRRPDNAPDFGTATHNSNGSIAFGDLDLSDAHVVLVTPLGGSYRGDFAATITQDSTGGVAGSVGWGFTINDGALADLQAGIPLIQDYAITIDDGHGGTVTRTVTITMQGGNTAPDAFDMAVTVDEDGPAATGMPFFFDPDSGDTHTVTVNTTGTIGQVTVNPDGTFTYNPAGRFEELAEGATATDSFQFTVTDSAGQSSTATAVVTVVGQNDGPVAQLIRGDADEEGGTALPPFFRDPDTGDTHTITVDTTGTRGTVTIRPDGLIAYEAKHKFNDLSGGQTAIDTFTYTVTDDHGASSTATATMTITGANDLPTLQAMSGTVGPDDTVQLIADFFDPDTADIHTLGIDSTGTLGVVTMTGGLGFQYDPNGQFDHLQAGQTATDTFRYSITDPSGITLFQDVIITIEGRNTAPDAFDMAVAVDEDGPAATGMPFFADPDAGDVHTVTVNTSGTVGSVVVNPNGTFTYDPTGRFEGLAEGATATDTFEFTVTDAAGASSTATATVTVVGQNDGPVAQLIRGDADEEGGTALAPVFQDIDAGDTHTITVDATGTRGAVTVRPDGLIGYEAKHHFDDLAAGQTAIDTFTYTVTDNNGASSSATATMTITGVNDLPILQAMSGTVGNTDTLQLIADFFDPDIGDTHNLGLDTGGTLGVVTMTGGVGFQYDPNGQFDHLHAGQTATDTFRYSITDSSGITIFQDVVITIEGRNTVPDAFDMAVAVDEDGPAATGMPFFADPDAGDTHTVTVNTSGTVGQVTVNPDGTFTYNPAGRFEELAEGATATDTFEFTVTDAAGASATATAMITVVGQNDAPVAQLIRGDADEEGGTALAPVFRDIDAGDTHTITVDSTGTRGAVTIRPDGLIGYEAKHHFDDLAAGQTAIDTFTYTVTDNNGASSSATATMTITGVNDLPILQAMSGTVGNTDTLQLIADFFDPDIGDTHNLGLDTGGTLGVVTMTGGVGFQYDPNSQFDHLQAGQTATDTFRYSITDSSGITIFQDVVITIEGRNTAPQAFDMAAAIDEDGPAATGMPFFADPDAGDTHTVTVNTSGTVGHVVVNPDGTFTYDPAGRFEELGEGATATDSFEFTVTDSFGASSTATATITVVGQNDGPVAQLIRGDADEEGGTALAPFFRDVDAGDTHTVTVDTTGTRGSVTVRPDGLIAYEARHHFDDLGAGETAIDTFTYTVTDSAGASSTAEATMTITGANDRPEALDLVADVDEDGPSVTVLPLFIDPDANDVFTIDIDASGALGLVTINPDGTLQYDPNGQFEALNSGQSAIDTFTYTITDSQGATSTATVTVTISGADDIPPEPLFTSGNDSVDFDGVFAANYVAGTQYDSLDGDDGILLPSTAFLAARSGYSAGTPVHGGTGNDVIVVRGDAVDVVFGDDDNDTIDATASAGADQLFGGQGDDVIDSAGQFATVEGGDGFDSLSGLNGATVYGGGDDDTITVAGATAYGGLGNDIVIGNGSSELYGDGGEDLMFGGAGDRLMGGEGNDQLLGAAGASVMGEGGNDTLIIIDGAWAAGGDGADTIFGGAGTTLLGERDDDTLYVVSSSQTAIGGEGTDTAIFTDARDVVTELGNIDVERIEMADGDDDFDVGIGSPIGVNVYGGIGDDVLQGRGGSDTLSGDIGDDVISGGDSADSLFGGDGDDRLQGGTDTDFLTGGANADMFVATANDSRDTILDFEDGIDVIDATALGIGFGDINLIDTPDGVLIELGAGGPAMLLAGKNSTIVDASDFLF